MALPIDRAAPLIASPRVHGTWDQRWTGQASTRARPASPGRRWRVNRPGMAFVCLQTLLTSWAQRSEDLTFDKTDEQESVLIARLTARLRYYIPEPPDETWGRLRHLGARRERLLAETVSQVQQIRDLLECGRRRWTQPSTRSALGLGSPR